MGLTFPAPVKASMAASGGPAPVTLLEIYTVAGNYIFWSDMAISTASVLIQDFNSLGVRPRPLGTAAPPPIPTLVNFAAAIIAAPVIRRYKSVKPGTATVGIENVSGDTLRRTLALMFSTQELIGALAYLRCFRVDSQYAIDQFMGNVSDLQLDATGDQGTLSLVSTDNWAQVPAPREQIGPSCASIFNNQGSFYACGSTSATPCNNDYGTCSSLNRFKGFPTEWVGSALVDAQIAQTPPLRIYNPRSAG